VIDSKAPVTAGTRTESMLAANTSMEGISPGLLVIIIMKNNENNKKSPVITPLIKGSSQTSHRQISDT
jgi:hypothetical protein